MDRHFKGKGKQGRLAAALGCRPPFVSDVLNGKKPRFSRELLENLVNVVNEKKANDVTLDWLETGEGEAPNGFTSYGTGEIVQTQPMKETASNEMEARKWKALVEWIVSDWPDEDLKKLASDATQGDEFEHSELLIQLLKQRQNRTRPAGHAQHVEKVRKHQIQTAK